MTDEISRAEFEELKERVAELEERVKNGAGDSQRDLLDRYDTYVVERVESVTDAGPRHLMRLYDKAGVVKKKKKKRRAKRLKRLASEGEL